MSALTTTSPPDVAALLDELEELRANVEREGQEQLARWSPSLERESYAASAENLASYLALRRRDLRELQTALMPLGLSSLGRCEARVLPNLDAVVATLARLADRPSAERPPHPDRETFFRGTDMLRTHTDELFGPAPAGRDVRIMVTLGGETADDPALVDSLVRHGMDVARINCAHDAAGTWVAIADHVRRATRASGRECKVCMDLCGPRSRTTGVASGEVEVRVEIGDRVLLCPGDPIVDPSFRAAVGCSLPEAVQQLEPGATVWIDEGRIGATVREKQRAGAVLEVDYASPGGGRLRAGKGLNFPTTELRVSPLTSKDLDDLDVVAAHADLIGYSFVQRREDVELMQAELAARTNEPLSLGLIAKIETAAAVRNLPEIIVQAAGRQPMGVMVARGDLAVEIGYPRLAEMQEELLWICEAAHVPVVWATQVLDTFVRKGRASRAELTDVAMAERAECVMLNKGPFVVDALTILDDVLGRMESHQAKKTSRLRALRSW